MSSFYHSHLNRNNLESAVAEHLDYLHYLNDILSLSVTSLNEILCDHLLNRLFIPLYVYSLFEIPIAARKDEDTPRVSSSVALFLLSQVSEHILSIYLSIHLSIYLFIHTSIYLSIYLSIYSFTHPSIYQSIYSSIYLSIHSCTHLFINQSIYLFIMWFNNRSFSYYPIQH